MKNKLVLHLSAAKFAAELLENIAHLDLDKKILERAAAESVPTEDYPAWKAEVLNLRSKYQQLETSLTESARAAKKAEADAKK